MAKYNTLTRYLEQKTSQSLVLSFSEIDRIVGGLPPSARKHREWWENEKPGGSHVQSNAWLTGGYSVDTVDLGRETVTFSRIRL